MAAQPSLHLQPPPSWMLEWFPTAGPAPLAPAAEPKWPSRPFTLDPDIYQALLQPAVPMTIAAIYVTLVKFTNQYNRRRGFKPWRLSKTRAFFLFQQTHNIFLTVYSAFTFYGMLYTMRHSIPHAIPLSQAQLVENIDGLCKMQGPRGLGSAVEYNPLSDVYESKNSFVHLAANGLDPDPTDVGRIWNEGLAWWGWWFYLSKFYEVIDTFIILAKGKRSSTLQTYHHAGAMLSMWAGIRYMSPPIWLFCFLNSFIHTCMYFYYTLTTAGFKIPKQIKQTLTTCQILQFIVGVFFATVHLFITYDVPVSIAYTVASAAATAASSVSSVATEATKLANSPSVSSFAAAATTAAKDWSLTLKRWALRAANAEGPAENLYEQPSAGAIFEDPIPARDIVDEVRYRVEFQEVRCIETSGQTFAILINVVYLMPLMVLFARFFVKSYILEPAPKQAGGKPRPRRISESASEAVRRTSDAVEELGKSAEHFIGSIGQDAKEVSKDVPTKVSEMRQDIKKLSQEATGGRDVGEVIEEDESKATGGRDVGNVIEEDKGKTTTTASTSYSSSSHQATSSSTETYAEAMKEGLPGDEADGHINRADVSELPKSEFQTF